MENERQRLGYISVGLSPRRLWNLFHEVAQPSNMDYTVSPHLADGPVSTTSSLFPLYFHPPFRPGPTDSTYRREVSMQCCISHRFSRFLSAPSKSRKTRCITPWVSSQQRWWSGAGPPLQFSGDIREPTMKQGAKYKEWREVRLRSIKRKQRTGTSNRK